MHLYDTTMKNIKQIRMGASYTIMSPAPLCEKLKIHMKLYFKYELCKK